MKQQPVDGSVISDIMTRPQSDVSGRAEDLAILPAELADIADKTEFFFL